MERNAGGAARDTRVLGDRLRRAREHLGLRQNEVCAETDIGESTLSELELGKRSPSVAQLSVLAERYRKPLAYFFEKEESPAEVVLWRERPNEKAELYESDFLLDCRHYRNLEAWCHEERTCELPKVKPDSRTATYAWAESLAIDVRNELRLGDRPGLTLLQALEETCCVKVFHRAFEPTGTAASSLHPSFGAGILLNSRNAKPRRTFDLAHEFFHLLTWNVFRAESPTSHTEIEEKLADKFASVLLIPEESIKAAAARKSGQNDTLSLPDVADLAREFAVSISALLWRMHWVFHWNDQGKTKALITRAEAHAKMLEAVTNEDAGPASKPPRLPPRFYALAIRALRAGDVSVGRFAEYLGISRKEAMSYVEEEASVDETIQLSPS